MGIVASISMEMPGNRFPAARGYNHLEAPQNSQSNVMNYSINRSKGTREGRVMNIQLSLMWMLEVKSIIEFL